MTFLVFVDTWLVCLLGFSLKFFSSKDGLSVALTLIPPVLTFVFQFVYMSMLVCAQACRYLEKPERVPDAMELE